MGVAVMAKYKERAFLTNRKRKEFEESDQKCFDHHAFTLRTVLLMSFIVPEMW